ncbi:MAG: PTS mannose/fructose/sorbose/N-acetylgalactosamine transporter subunit IIC [Erysipelotrichaceae bacterium]
MGNALLIAFCYLLWQVADNWAGWQTFTRPLVLCTLTGLMCGDVTTGVILGAELEAVYMGVSAIGGETPSNYQAASVLCVGFVVLSNASMEVGLSLAITVGTLINALKPFTQAIALALHPWFMKIAETGNVKKFRIAMWIQVIFVSQLLNTVAVFLVALGGELGLQTLIAACPDWLLNGLNASANVLVVVGLCLTTQAIWNGTTTVMYVILGFVAVKYLNLPVLPIALIGVVIAYAHFQTRYTIAQSKPLASTAQSGQEGDDFYD